MSLRHLLATLTRVVVEEHAQRSRAGLGSGGLKIRRRLKTCPTQGYLARPHVLSKVRRFAGFFLCLAAIAQTPEPGSAPASWPPSGPKCMEVPSWQVHEYNPNFYIIRQSGCLDYEKPFVFLLFGKERGLLLDTGSRNFPAADMLQTVAGNWLKRTGRNHIDILAVHTHPHGDHVWGDEALKNMQSENIAVKVVPATLEATKALYGITNWPDQTGSIDLGDRIIDVIPIPGHSNLSVALYDRNTAILFTGDSLYPGRLYVSNWDDFVKSTQRLVDFTKGKLVSHILGNHIEQTRTAYLDYPVGTIYQPDEHALSMSRGDLLELMEALSSVQKPTRMALSDFTIWPSVHDPAADARFKAHEQEQKDHMWDQPNR